MSLIKWIDFKQRGDERGHLTVIEYPLDIPFEIRRVYYLSSLSPDLPRGFHAHKELQQVAVCVAGSCQVLLDNGNEKVWVTLDSPNQALRIEPLVWHEMHEFSKDCLFMVLASDVYKESDYIRSYDQFLRSCDAKS